MSGQTRDPLGGDPWYIRLIIGIVLGGIIYFMEAMRYLTDLVNWVVGR